MINSDIRTEKALEGKANYVIILRHFCSHITIGYHCHFLGSTPAASTTIFTKKSNSYKNPPPLNT